MDSLTQSMIRECFVTAAKIGGPLMLTALVIGVVISMFQAVTQINEATLSFLPKLIAISFAILLLGSYFARTMTSFSRSIFDHIIVVGGS